MGNDSIYSQFASMFKIYGSYLTSKLTSILDGLQLPRQLIVKPDSGGLELHIQETPQKGWCPHDDRCYPILEKTIPWAGFYPRIDSKIRRGSSKVKRDHTERRQKVIKISNYNRRGETTTRNLVLRKYSSLFK